MRKSVSLTGLIKLSLIILCSGFSMSLFSQEEIAMAPAGEDEFTFELPKALVKPTLADTILPTICNSGQGLLHYECLDENKNKACIHHDEGHLMAVQGNYSESEIRALKEQQRLMLEKSIIEIQQQIRKDKMDLQLGEMVKSFYMKPPF